MPTLELASPRGFDLRAAASFYGSFVPGTGMAAASPDGLTFAFHLDGTFEAVAMGLRQAAGLILVDYAGTRDAAAVAKQIRRMLGLDADGDEWLAVGRRDPVVGRLQAEFPGFFTAAKASPYDAATWAILAQRTGMTTAARWKLAIAEQWGQAVTLNDRTLRVFPSPEVLAARGEPGPLPAEKLERLRGIARAALQGRLDADRLRAMSEDEALADLMTLRGVGPWAASHILYRGAALQDALPAAEPRVLHGAASAYGIALPTAGAFEQMAEAWRPFRMWVAVLLSRHLARAGGWHSAALRGERSAAGRRLERRLGPGRGGA